MFNVPVVNCHLPSKDCLRGDRLRPSVGITGDPRAMIGKRSLRLGATISRLLGRVSDRGE